MAYPTGVKIYIDGTDATYYIFGTETIDPTADNNTFRNINISPLLRKSPGMHKIEITAADGSGRIECRVEVR